MRRIAWLLLTALALLAAPAAASAAVALAPASLTIDPGRAGSSIATVSVPGTADVEAPVLAVAGVGPGAAPGWVAIAAPQMGIVSPPLDIAYTVTVTPPRDTPGGTYSFDLGAAAGGADIGHATLTVTVTGPGAAGPLSLRRPVLANRWRESAYTGSVRLRGTAATDATIEVRLAGPGGERPLATPRAVTAGNLNRLLKLPGDLLPGSYELRVRGARPGGATATTTFPLVVTAPPEGIVRRAFVSGIRGGPPATSLPGARSTLFAIFRFTVESTRGELTIGWTRNGKALLSPAGKERTRVVEGFIKSGGALPVGRYEAILRAGSKVVARAGVRLTG